MPTPSRGDFVSCGSFNLHLWNQLSALTASWFTAWVTAPAESAYVRFDWGDEAPINPPCVTVQHFEPSLLYPGIGRQRVVNPTGGKGQPMRHLSEISCWVSRYSGGTAAGGENPNWQGQLRQLRDMVAYALNLNDRSLPLLDLTISTAAPFTTAGLIRVHDLRGIEAPPDPNPGLRRRRLLCSWIHIESQ